MEDISLTIRQEETTCFTDGCMNQVVGVCSLCQNGFCAIHGSIRFIVGRTVGASKVCTCNGCAAIPRNEEKSIGVIPKVLAFSVVIVIIVVVVAAVKFSRR
jgi:hypothetical protein